MGRAAFSGRWALGQIRDAGVKIKKRSKRLSLLFVIAGVLLSSCSSNGSVVRPTKVVTPSLEFLTPTKLPTPVNGISQVLLIDESHKDSFPMDAAKITSITLEKDILKINVTYQGGCQEHTFALHAETAFLQSYESQGVLYLSHDAHGDTCTENIEKLLSFDLILLNTERNDPSERPLLLRIYAPAGGSLAKEPYMPLIEWP